MSRRARLLIYDGPDEWIQTTKAWEFVQLGKKELGEGKSIMSVELNAAELTLFQCQVDEIESIPSHRWEPDFSDGEPTLNSKKCGVCGKEHTDGH